MLRRSDLVVPVGKFHRLIGSLSSAVTPSKTHYSNGGTCLLHGKGEYNHMRCNPLTQSLPASAGFWRLLIDIRQTGQSFYACQLKS